MIKVFRRIRKQLVEDRKITKYLFYAIGEIVLVVIGILLALYINNKSEKQSNEVKFAKVIKELRQDLLADLINSEQRLVAGKEMDSLTSLILKNAFSKEDYLKKENRRLFWVGLQYNSFNYQKTSFRKIENFKGHVPDKYNELTKKINVFFNVTGKFYDDEYNHFREQIKERNDYLANNYNWYYLFRKGETTKEMLDFYLKSSIYKNWISRHQADHTTSNHGVLSVFQFRGFSLIAEINHVLKDDFSITNKALLEKYGAPLKGKTEFPGKYRVKESQESINVREIGGYLFIDNFLMKNVSKDTLSYIRESKSMEVAVRNSKGAVVGIRFISLKDSTRNEYSEKIFNE